MTQLIRSEVRKVFSTRTPLWFFLGMFVIAGPGVLLANESTDVALSKPPNEQIWFFITAGFTRLLVFVLGVRMMTDEFRHGTVVPSFLATPGRWKVVAAKAAVMAAVGFIFTLLAEGVMLGGASMLLSSRGIPFTLPGETIDALIGMALAGACWSAVGTAVGAMVGGQMIATVGGLLWLMPGGGIEDLVRDQMGRAGEFLPGNLGMALAIGAGEASLLLGGALLVGYTVAATAGAVALTRVRDY